MKIAKMTVRHLDDVTRIENICFTVPWSKSDFKKELENNDFAHYFVAESEGKVVAYAGLWHIITEGHITNIAVLPDIRRSGVGSQLVLQLIEFAYAREMCGLTLEVNISNIAAQKLYIKHGFKPEGFRKEYYKDTKEDAIIMWKYLNV
jgi:ribosomal-protein-alanine N-acetyltransferase